MKIVPFCIVGLFIDIYPISLCGASAAGRLWRKNEIPMCLWVTEDMVLYWIQLKMIRFSKSSTLAGEG